MAFESQHDAGRLGPLQAHPSDTAVPGGKLASLLDVLAFVTEREGLPRNPAAQFVLDKLQPTPLLYLTVPDEYAVRIADDHEWLAAVEAQAAKTVPHYSRPREFSATSWGDDKVRRRETKIHTPPRQAHAGVYGPAGALQLLAASLLGSADRQVAAAATRYAAARARLAIPLNVASALFGFGPERSFWESEPTPAPGPSMQVQAPAPPSDLALSNTVGQAVSGLPADGVLYAEWNDLNGKSKSPTLDLANKYGVSRDTIQRRCKKGAPPEATKSPKTTAQNSVFDTRKRA